LTIKIRDGKIYKKPKELSIMMMQSIFRFPGFLTRACTLSYDDGVSDDERLIGIMRKYGLKGTFNLNSMHLVLTDDKHLSVNKIKELYGEDTEIAIHGYRHLLLENYPAPLAFRDIIANREHLEKSFNRVVRGMAYAYGSYNEEVIDMLRKSGVAYARTTKSTEGFDLPTEWLTLHPTCHHNNPRLFELIDEFLAEAPRGIRNQKPRLFYLWGHSYEFPRDNNWDVIERFGEKMAASDKVWHATNMEVYKYVEAFNRLVFALDMSCVENPSAIDVYITVNGKDIIAKAGETTDI